ncbi:hypothetical protein KI688_001792 [Linnemannia hyalina]|uniref:Ubinuclein middle domain-containing protein n=1 Tax=Linnemannia hyalina TaxID=64524 RepID=A0A9P7XT87_9FUNG|nr:hypothetical protein KI688_001792 [Linnemannia hyalina]
MPSSFQQGSSSKASIRVTGHQFSRSDAELADILARPRGEQTQVTNDGVRVFVDLSKHTIVNFVDLVAQQHAQRALARKKEAKLAKKQQHAKRIAEPESSDAMEVDPPEETGPESAVHSEVDGDGEDVGESVGESDNSDNSDNNSEDSNDNDSDNPPPKKDFLDNLMDRFEKLYYVLDEEDEEERRAHEEGRPQKKRSRWDFESYDVNDDFIDDSEAMVQSMGIKLRPKESGFYVCRGPLVMVPVDEPSTPRKRGGAGAAGGGRRRAPAGTTTAKGSNLAIVESAIEWTPEVSETERKPSGKSSNGEGGSTAPKKKRTTKAKTVTMADDADNDTNNDSDKQTKAPAPKRAKAKTTKTPAADTAVTTQESSAAADASTTSTPNSDPAASKSAIATTSKASTTSKTKTTAGAKATGSSSATSTAAIPTVRVDSPPPTLMDGVEDSSTPQPPPSRPVSPLKVKSRSKAKASKAQQDGSLSADPATDDALTEDDTTQEPHAMDTSADNTVADTIDKVTPPSNDGSREGESRSSSPAPRRMSNSQGPARDDGLESDDQVVELGPKPEEPLPDELKSAFRAVEELAEKEPWEGLFPAPVRTAMFTFGHKALEYCKGSGKIIPEVYFDHLRSIIPYQGTTLRKLIYRMLLPNWIKDLEFEKTKYIGQFTERTKKVLLTSGLANQATIQDADGDVNLSGDEGKFQKKFPWTHDLRLLLWETMEMFMEIRQAKHEFHSVKNSYPAPPTDSKTRKDAYQTLLLAFPSGWTTSYEISRQYSQLKEKVQKQRNDKKEVEVTKPVLVTKTKAATGGAASRPPKAVASPAGPTTSTTKLTKSLSSTKLTAGNTSTNVITSPTKSTTTASASATPAKATSTVASTASSAKPTSSPTLPTKVSASAANTASSPLLSAVKPDISAGPRDSPPVVARRVTPNATSSSARSPANLHRATATPEPPHLQAQHGSKPPQPQQSRLPSQPPMQHQTARTHFTYTGGPISSGSAAPSLSKKRKNSVGVAQGSGSNADPLVIDEGPVQGRDYGHERRRSPQPYYRDASYPSQVSYSSQDMAGSKSSNSSAANKKSKASAGDYGDYRGPSPRAPSPGASGSARVMDSTGSFSGYHRAVGSGRGGRLGGVGVGPRDGPGPLQQHSSSMRRSYSPPPMQNQRLPPVYRSQQPEPLMQYREGSDMPSYHHHRSQQQQHEMSRSERDSGRMYSPSSMHSPPTSSSSPGPGSARHPGRPVQQPPSHHQRSPDDLLRHPPSHRSQQQQQSQSPSSHYSHRR